MAITSNENYVNLIIEYNNLRVQYGGGGCGDSRHVCSEETKHVAATRCSYVCLLTITGGGDGKCVAEFTVSEEHLNRGGGLHGGFTATIVDNITTFALMTKDCNPGVTVDLHVSFLKAAREGDEVIVDATTVKAGRTLAYIECELRHKKDGSIIAKGGQTKFVATQK